MMVKLECGLRWLTWSCRKSCWRGNACDIKKQIPGSIMLTYVEVISGYVVLGIEKNVVYHVSRVLSE